MGIFRCMILYFLFVYIYTDLRQSKDPNAVTKQPKASDGRTSTKQSKNDEAVSEDIETLSKDIQGVSNDDVGRYYKVEYSRQWKVQA